MQPSGKHRTKKTTNIINLPRNTTPPHNHLAINIQHRQMYSTLLRFCMCLPAPSSKSSSSSAPTKRAACVTKSTNIYKPALHAQRAPERKHTRSLSGQHRHDDDYRFFSARSRSNTLDVTRTNHVSSRTFSRFFLSWRWCSAWTYCVYSWASCY